MKLKKINKVLKNAGTKFVLFSESKSSAVFGERNHCITSSVLDPPPDHHLAVPEPDHFVSQSGNSPFFSPAIFTGIFWP
jgi:hypothetical protein